MWVPGPWSCCSSHTDLRLELRGHLLQPRDLTPDAVHLQEALLQSSPHLVRPQTLVLHGPLYVVNLQGEERI